MKYLLTSTLESRNRVEDFVDKYLESNHEIVPEVISLWVYAAMDNYWCSIWRREDLGLLFLSLYFRDPINEVRPFPFYSIWKSTRRDLNVLH